MAPTLDILGIENERECPECGNRLMPDNHGNWFCVDNFNHTFREDEINNG